MFIIQCPILWYAKVCALPSARSSLKCFACSFVIFFQGGVQVSGFRSRCLWLPAAARRLPSSKGLLQLYRKLLLPQHISDGHQQPRLHRLELPGAVMRSAGIGLLVLTHRTTRVSAGRCTGHYEYAFNSSSPGLHRDGDAHVHRRHPGHVWTRGLELHGLLWRVQRPVWCQAASGLGRHGLRGEGHRLAQQHHLQVNAAWVRQKVSLVGLGMREPFWRASSADGYRAATGGRQKYVHL